ncbi:hypothetical protein AM1_D0067 (plasmid) [Acaryochloris marina MBIC11017]|uniref:Uncharacterized protein n=1 Tax=Acaryochloris marina (strain MBIC 11017) TaxID=329726 RepID=A8ZNH6_ACAM1|nr:hypothetical protein AM1_D0067 [Acaryochloris marina MBIC11017]
MKLNQYSECSFTEFAVISSVIGVWLNLVKVCENSRHSCAETDSTQ